MTRLFWIAIIFLITMSGCSSTMAVTKYQPHARHEYKELKSEVEPAFMITIFRW